MKKQFRIKDSSEIERVMKKGISRANKSFIVYRLKQENEKKSPQIAVSAPKKLGNAVTRNQIKRKLRATIQTNFSSFDSGHDYFIIARPDVLEIDFNRFEKQLKHVISLHRKKNTHKKSFQSR